MTTAIFPGSFDPLTLGHLDLIERAGRLCDTLIVGVLYNPDKSSFFTPQQRVDMIHRALGNRENVRVVQFAGLMVELARQENASFVIRGVRGAADLQSESAMAHANGLLLPGLETVFLPASAQFEAISSSLVRQIAQFGGNLNPFVPAALVDEIAARFYNGNSHIG